MPLVAPQPALSSLPAFMRFWCERLAATMGNQMLMMAIGWQMYGLTGSASDLGLVGLYQFGPALALVLWAGHAADSHERRRILALCIGVQVTVTLVLLAAAQGRWASREPLLGCGIASWGGQRLSMGDYVTGTGATRGATAAGGG